MVAAVQSSREITARQLDVLRFIRDHIAREGFAPTIREIGAALGISSNNGVHEHVQQLIRKGALSQKARASRSFRVLIDPDTVEGTHV